MVRLTVALKAPPRGGGELDEALRYLGVTTRHDAGCLGCSAWADGDGVVHYVEEWVTEDQMRQRVRSERFVSLLAVLESAAEAPQVQFDFVTTTRGLDYVAEAREQGRSGDTDV